MNKSNIFNKKDPDGEFEGFLQSYQKHRNKPMRILLSLYKGNIKKILLSSFFFVIKASPLWIIPIVTANIVDIATHPNNFTTRSLWLNIIIAAVFIVVNLPMHMLYVKFYSVAIRYVEAGLRSTLIRKLQQLSISFHKEFKSGRMQSKIIRDVENIEFLSQQIMNSILSVIVTTIVVLSIVISKSLLMTVFFLISIPVALLLVYFFRKNMRQKNSEFRTEIEETSARVAEMVEMIPVTKAHGLEDVEIRKMDDQLLSVRKTGSARYGYCSIWCLRMGNHAAISDWMPWVYGVFGISGQNQHRRCRFVPGLFCSAAESDFKYSEYIPEHCQGN